MKCEIDVGQEDGSETRKTTERTGRTLSQLGSPDGSEIVKSHPANRTQQTHSVKLSPRPNYLIPTPWRHMCSNFGSHLHVQHVTTPCKSFSTQPCRREPYRSTHAKPQKRRARAFVIAKVRYNSCKQSAFLLRTACPPLYAVDGRISSS